MSDRWEPLKITGYAMRAVRALESIADSLKKRPASVVQNISSPKPLDATEVYKDTKSPPDGGIEASATDPGLKLPAFLLAGRNDEFDFDEETANGYGRIEDDQIVITLPKHYYPDVVKHILAEGEPAAFGIRIFHRKDV